MTFSLVSGCICFHEWSEPLLIEHVVTLLVDLRAAHRFQKSRPILILSIRPSALATTSAGDVLLTAQPAIVESCRELLVVADAADARRGTLRSVFAEPRASQHSRPATRHCQSIDDALRHVESVAPYDILGLKRQLLRRLLPPRGR
jgi:hypothetical protein